MEKKNGHEVDILFIFRVFLNRWYLFLISGIIFITLGIFYYKYAPKTYAVYGRISLSSEQNSSVRGANTYVNINEMMGNERDYTDQIAYMSSTPLLKEVITDLNLTCSYYIQEDKIPKSIPLGYINIYDESPFIVIVNKEHIQPLGTLFYMQIIDESTFNINAEESSIVLYDYKNEVLEQTETPFQIDGTFAFGEEITNGKCSFKVLLNSNYNSDEYQGKDLFFRFNSPTALVKRFSDALSIRSAFYESSITNLTLEWDNIKLAMDMLTSLINKYSEQNLAKKNENANNTLAYIDNQLDNISGTLGASERQLQNFKRSQDMMDIDQKTTNVSGQIRTFETRRDELNTRLQNFERLADYFTSTEDLSNLVIPSYIGMSDNTISSLYQELNTLITERQNLINTNQLRNPRIKTLDANINAIIKVIRDNVNFNITSVRNEINEVDKKLRNLYSDYSSLPQAQRQLIGLEREYNLNDAVYSSLLERRIQAQIIKASNVSDCEIIEPVTYTETTNPSIKKIGVISVFLGMLFPMIYVIFTSFLTNRIKSKDELKRLSKLTMIGSLPHNDSKHTNVVQDHSLSPIAEGFHNIRSSIIYYLMGEKNKCILVTSSNPSEGKSFISLNLASSFASTHHKTILINFDLRKKNGQFNDLISAPPLVGLSAYMINRATINDIIIKTNVENLDLIQNIELPPNPIALLSSPKVKELFTYLRKNYDYIFIDSPPFGMVADAFLLMSESDLTVFISRAGYTIKRILKQSIEEIESKKIDNIYQIYNDIAKIDKAFNHKYAYAYGPSQRKGIFKGVISKIGGLRQR